MSAGARAKMAWNRRNEHEMFVWPQGCEEKPRNQRAVYLRREARAIRRARQITAKQDLLRKMQEQTRTFV
eukprot:458916-Alexandrium_andersonii.AAC.1